MIGRPVSEVLGLQFDERRRPGRAPSLEWGVRALDKPVEVNAEGDLPGARDGRPVPRLRRRRRAAARAHPRRSSLDPRRDDRPPPQRPRSCCSSSGLLVASRRRHRDEADAAGPRPQGRRRARLPGQADAAAAEGHAARRSTARSTSCASASTSSASPSRRSSAPARTRSRSACPTSRTPQRAEQQVGTTAQLYFYDWETNVLGAGRQAGTRPTPNVTGGPSAGAGGRPARVLRRGRCARQARRRANHDGNGARTDGQYYLGRRQDRRQVLRGPEEPRPTCSGDAARAPGPPGTRDRQGQPGHDRRARPTSRPGDEGASRRTAATCSTTTRR